MNNINKKIIILIIILVGLVLCIVSILSSYSSNLFENFNAKRIIEDTNSLHMNI